MNVNFIRTTKKSMSILLELVYMVHDVAELDSTSLKYAYRKVVSQNCLFVPLFEKRLLSGSCNQLLLNKQNCEALVWSDWFSRVLPRASRRHLMLNLASKSLKQTYRLGLEFCEPNNDALIWPWHIETWQSILEHSQYCEYLMVMIMHPALWGQHRGLEWSARGTFLKFAFQPNDYTAL